MAEKLCNLTKKQQISPNHFKIVSMVDFEIHKTGINVCIIFFLKKLNKQPLSNHLADGKQKGNYTNQKLF